jgi:hypothetical protein
VALEVGAEGLRRCIVGLFSDYDRLRNDETAEVVAPKRQLEVLEARFLDSFRSRPYAGGPIAIREAAQNSVHHGAGCFLSDRLRWA